MKKKINKFSFLNFKVVKAPGFFSTAHFFNTKFVLNFKLSFFSTLNNISTNGPRPAPKIKIFIDWIVANFSDNKERRVKISIIADSIASLYFLYLILSNSNVWYIVEVKFCESGCKGILIIIKIYLTKTKLKQTCKTFNASLGIESNNEGVSSIKLIICFFLIDKSLKFSVTKII